MIKNLKNIIKCKINGHVFVNAGSCPFTGKTYEGCSVCGKMITV